jgi:2-dehydropantoate 2-reductase
VRFLIIGAGGIGCYYGARLQNAGHGVTYVARGKHLNAMQQHGLIVTHEDFEFHESVEAVDIHQLIQEKACHQYDLIMLATKGGSTSVMLEVLKSWLAAANTPFLSLQNGVDNESLIAEVIGEKRTLGGLAVRIGGHIISPGKIEATGPAQVILGPWPSAQSCSAQELQLIENVSRELNSAKIPTQVSSNIQHELWRKLIINNGVNPLSALTGLDTKALTSHPVLTKTVYCLMEEVASVAKADNVILSKGDVDSMYELICTFDAIKTSMLVDKEKGRPLELNSICGAVLYRAAKLGIDTPTTELVNSLLMLEE